ncbi:MAG TPA: hypothetical protein VFE52_08525, partial [Devosia sp.]|nr:hypothetical protein [Devosia sp.]
MTDNIIPFRGQTTLDISPEAVLGGAEAAGLDLETLDAIAKKKPAETIVIGIDADGRFYLASSIGSNERIVYLLAKA